MTKRDIAIKGHSALYKLITSYNSKLPVYFVVKDEKKRLELFEIRKEILDYVDGINKVLNNPGVLEALEYHKYQHEG